MECFRKLQTNLVRQIFALTVSLFVTRAVTTLKVNIYEPRCEKTGFFAYAKTKTQISFAVTAKLISAFVFATRKVQFLYYLNPKFQASNHLLWLYSPVCVGPGRKPRRPVFSERGSYGMSLMIRKPGICF